MPHLLKHVTNRSSTKPPIRLLPKEGATKLKWTSGAVSRIIVWIAGPDVWSWNERGLHVVALLGALDGRNTAKGPAVLLFFLLILLAHFSH